MLDVDRESEKRTDDKEDVVVGNRKFPEVSRIYRERGSKVVETSGKPAMETR